MPVNRVFDSIDSASLKSLLDKNGAKKPMVVCDGAYSLMPIKKIIENACPHAVVFNAVQPNPRYEDIIIGVGQFREHGCDSIISIGGGSAIDSAKCIGLFSAMPECEDYTKAERKPFSGVHICIPTTAGTGSEVTRYAIIYKAGKKINVTDYSIIPGFCYLLPELLRTLPDYQKKATLLDAYCHAIESMWATASTEESCVYAKQAIRLISENASAYLDGDEAAAAAVLLGSNLAGKAINISATTAAHAMGYKLTTEYGISHGHAVALGLIHNWRLINKHIDHCRDGRGEAHLREVLSRLEELTGGVDAFEELFNRMKLELPFKEEAPSAKKLAEAVDTAKLRNHPIYLTEQEIEAMYKNILKC